MDLRNERGFTLVEVLVAIGVLAIALVALMAMLSRGSLNVYVGGGQSKATAYARQMVEQLRNQPVTVPCFAVVAGCANQTDIPEGGIARTWTVAQVNPAVYTAPNRLWRITVTVTVAQSAQMTGGQNITIETMRAE